MKGRKILILLMLMFLWSLTVFPAGAERLPVIQDDADLLTAEEEAALYEDMLPICEYGTPLFWTTTESGTYQTKAERFYHRHLAEGESGTLFMIDMGSRYLYIFSDGAIYRTMTTGEAETVTDNVFRQAGRGEYYACASSAFRQIHSLLLGKQIARPMKLTSNVLLALVLALLGVYLYIRGRYETHPKSGKLKAALPVTAAAAAAFTARTLNTQARMTKQKKTDISSSSGGGGGHYGGGGHSGGGGGHSGGGGGHGF